MYPQAFVGPAINPGVDGGVYTMVSVRKPLGPQPFSAATLTVPPIKPEGNVTAIEVSFTPRPLMWVMLAGNGTDHT